MKKRTIPEPVDVTSVTGLEVELDKLANKTEVNGELSRRTTRVMTLADLRNLPIHDGRVVLLLGKASILDNQGGFYRFDGNSTAPEDTTFMNIIISNLSERGRWIRVFQWAQELPHGKLVTNGGMKTFFVIGTSTAAGDVTVSLTRENNATGTPIFTDIWSILTHPMVEAASISGAVMTFRKSLSSDLKTLTYGLFRPNVNAVGQGVINNPFVALGAGIKVQFRIEGI